MAPALPEYLTTDEVAARLRLTPQRIHQLARAGSLRSFRVGRRGRLRFRSEDVLRLLGSDDEQTGQTEREG